MRSILLKATLANSTDPDQMPRFAASDLVLHCLHNCMNFIAISARNDKYNKIKPDIPKMINGIIQCKRNEESLKYRWVREGVVA